MVARGPGVSAAQPGRRASHGAGGVCFLTSITRFAEGTSTLVVVPSVLALDLRLSDDAATLPHSLGVIRLQSRQGLPLTARPEDLGRDRSCVTREPEGQRKLALREVAGAALHPLHPAAGLGLDHRPRADPIAGARPAEQRHPQHVVAVAAVVPEEDGGAAIAGGDDVEVAVTVEIGVGGAPSDELPRQRRPGLRRDLAEALLRSEEHTSELQSLAYLVCRLLLEKKKKISHHTRTRGGV